MIVPMDKVSLVVMDKEKQAALEKLRELGILHLEKKQVQSDVLSRLLEKKTRAENALALLRSSASIEKKRKKSGPAGGTGGGGAGTGTSGSGGAETDAGGVDAVLALNEEKKSLQEQLSALVRERTRVEKWGDFDPAAFTVFAEKGIALVPYELSVQSYEKIGEDIRLVVLSRTKTGVRVVALGGLFGGAAGGEIPGETPFALPEKSLSEIDRQTAEIRGGLAALDKKLAGLVPAIPAITCEYEKILEDVEFETAGAGMDILEENAGEGENFNGRTISWLSGYIPRERIGVLKRGAVENGWAFIADEPGPDDPVPTLLKHNRFVKLLNPLTGFLEVVPGYHEADISLWFLLFFVVFFGMIFGDAGYGALLLLTGIGGCIATAKKGVPGILKLLCLLAFSNLVWGVLTCSWFGIGVEYIPGFLKNLSLPLVSNVTSAASEYGKKIVQQNLMIFCFSLALLQLSIGHIISIFNNRSLKILGELGNIAMLGGMYFIILGLIASNEFRQIPLFPQAVYVFAAGFILNFIFINYDGSIGRSILESLKNIISVVLGIANVFSDIMSYIRLWAVGLAGAAIADTVDKMAGPMLGHFIFFAFGILLLVFGHGLNIMLNVLSVLVHGVRLNTLEFSGHAGVTWSGSAYKPFSKRGPLKRTA